MAKGLSVPIFAIPFPKTRTVMEELPCLDCQTVEVVLPDSARRSGTGALVVWHSREEEGLFFYTSSTSCWYYTSLKEVADEDCPNMYCKTSSSHRCVRRKFTSREDGSNIERPRTVFRSLLTHPIFDMYYPLNASLAARKSFIIIFSVVGVDLTTTGNYAD